MFKIVCDQAKNVKAAFANVAEAESSEEVIHKLLVRQNKLDLNNKDTIDFLEKSDECKVFQLKQELYHVETMINLQIKNYKNCFFCQIPIIDTTQINEHIHILKERKLKLENSIRTFSIEKDNILKKFATIKIQR